jgi:adenylate cyclase
MDRVFQWLWDRHGPRYSWAMCVFIYPPGFFVFLCFALTVVAFERSDRFADAAVVTALAMLVRVVVLVLPGSKDLRLLENWAAGHEIDRSTALRATFAYTRRVAVRLPVVDAMWTAALGAVVGGIAGASGSRLIQYAVVGAAYGAAVGIINMHGFVEGALRPARAAISGDTGLGDSLPRSRPSFATWSKMATLAVAFAFALAGAFLASLIDRAREEPVVAVAIACVLTLVSGQLTVAATAPFWQPIRDLARGTERVSIGDFSQRLPVVQDDDLGALAASFNRMQAGLAERQRLQSAFGTYVDPALAARLLAQGDDVFTGERREVTVMFVDVRDFTPFAEANSAEDTVARLNELFEIVVPAVVAEGGHVNKFLGDGALAVFGAPNDLERHADAAVAAATEIQRSVGVRFGGGLRVGVGINTGVVIAGTIGAGAHLEFTLIGDTTNVAARVEQLTKTTGDVVLVTEQTVHALSAPPPELTFRGAYAVKGRSDPVRVFGLDPGVPG